jgi:hypothetical protein
LAAIAGSDGKVILRSVRPGAYSLSIQAGRFYYLSRKITINNDIDLGRILLVPDPDILPGRIAGPPPLSTVEESRFYNKDDYPRSIRGRIKPASFFTGRRLMVQLSCSVRLPGLPERPPIDVTMVPVDETGGFVAPVPECSEDLLAHREIRFCLKNKEKRIVALMLPKLTGSGYYQSRFGIWLPVKSVSPEETQEGEFALEYTDNRPLQASISVTSSSWGGLLVILTNTSDEVIAVRPAETDFFSDPDWIILDEHGGRVPLRLFRDRTREQTEERLGAQRFLFPGESETYDVNIRLEFELNAPGTYRAIARRIIGRPELPGVQVIVSPQSTFVITSEKRP